MLCNLFALILWYVSLLITQLNVEIVKLDSSLFAEVLFVMDSTVTKHVSIVKSNKLRKYKVCFG